jgi:predicted small lipoprotein YifL
MHPLRLAFLAIAVLSASAAGGQAGPLPGSVPPAGSRLNDAEKLEKSAEHLARMKAAMKQVLGRLEEARNEKDVVKLNCVNEKLTQIKGLLKVAEQADISLHEAVSANDEGADSEFAKIGIARTKVEGLRGDSEHCIGQLAYIVDEKTTVEVQLPSDLPGRADWGRSLESGPPWGAAPPVVRYPEASPYH